MFDFTKFFIRQISDVSCKPLHSANLLTNLNDLNVDNYTSINVILKMRVNNIQAQCLLHDSLNDEVQGLFYKIKTLFF